MIETTHLVLRSWKEGDKEPFARMNADPHVMEFMPNRLTAAECNSWVDWIKDHFARHGFGLCAVELKSDGRFIGFIGVQVPSFQAHFTPCVEIGWRLAADCWGKGLATEGASAVVEACVRCAGIGKPGFLYRPREHSLAPRDGKTRHESESGGGF